ncbi:MAG: tyrosyl-tRNA synthetase [Tremellales sp. Tagirdzhanova-0007]|nr:MAG: tyrosyl-tRNA synthetase [Tremellales sp. Tagirdzhanova-0007]
MVRRLGQPRCFPNLRRYQHTFGLKPNLLQELSERGFVSALTSPELNTHVNSPTCVYAGIDPSASSLHVGNLLPLMGLLHFQAAGHQAITLIGGATGSIGDPSGRSTERPILSPSQLQENVQGITAQVHRFFARGHEYMDESPTLKGKEREGRSQERVLNNLDWFSSMGILDFLRDVGKLARVNVILAREPLVFSSASTIQPKNSRTPDGEFSYQLLQAYDFSVLNRDHGCRVQLGGSDQWGNIVAGIELIKRQRAALVDSAEKRNSGESKRKTTTKKKEGKDGEDGKDDDEYEVFGLTIPLLTAENGDKFGKSAGNAIWLDEKRTSVSDFYQFFLRTTDERVDQYLKLFTLLPLERIEQAMSFHMRPDRRKMRTAQTLLADEVTRLIHGAEGVHRAHLARDILFRSAPLELTTSSVLEALDSDPKLKHVKWSEVKGVPVTKLAVVFGLCKSRAEATRAVSIEKCFWINQRKVGDPRDELKRSDLVDGHIIVIKVGMKQHIVLNVESAPPIQNPIM